MTDLEIVGKAIVTLGLSEYVAASLDENDTVVVRALETAELADLDMSDIYGTLFTAAVMIHDHTPVTLRPALDAGLMPQLVLVN